MAPATTLSANEGGGLLPTLGFGIPGGESMAVLLAAFIVAGVVPGPQMLTTGLPLVFTMIWTIVFANILTAGIGLFTAPLFRPPHRAAQQPARPLRADGVLRRRHRDQPEPGRRGRCGAARAARLRPLVLRYSLANVAIGFVLGSILEPTLHISITLHGSFLFVERGYYIPAGTRERCCPQSNDVQVDPAAGLIYMADRWGLGLHIMEYTG